MTFEAGLFRRPKGRWIVRVVVNIVVARGAGILQLLDMEPVRNGDIVRVDFWRSPLHIEHTLMAADAVWVDLVQFGREARVFPSALEGEDVDARHQGVTGRMTLRAVNLRVEGGLLPEGRFPLLMVTGDAEFLLRRGIGGQGRGEVKPEHGQNTPEGPGPEGKVRNLKVQSAPPWCTTEITLYFPEPCKVQDQSCTPCGAWQRALGYLLLLKTIDCKCSSIYGVHHSMHQYGYCASQGTSSVTRSESLLPAWLNT